jgi:hypothetical protein
VREKIANLASLTAIQVSSAVLPLVIFPFVLGVAGTQAYSKIVLGEAMSLFLVAVVLYSFEVDGIAQVVGRDPRADIHHISRVFSGILCLRLLLFLVTAPLVVVVAMLMDRQLVPFALCWMLIPLGYALQPNWLYQGLERNAPVAVIVLFSRAAAVSIIWTMIDKQSNPLLIPLIIGSCYLLGAVLVLVHAIRTIGIRIVPVKFDDLKDMLWRGKEVFLGNLSVILYRDANVIILTTVGASAPAIAAYSMAEKFVKAMQAGIRPLNQFFFPKAVRLGNAAGKPSPAAFKNLMKITAPQFGGLIFILAIVGLAYFFALPRFSVLRSMQTSNEIALLTLIMSGGTFFGVANFMFGTSGLNVMNARRYYFLSILGTGMLSVLVSILLTSKFGAHGAATSFVIAEAILFCLIAKRYFR